jgi:predicted unusual protein kinase regulating ubiquinone biosynthesis (AarF/ABC1/UbiB family)
MLRSRANTEKSSLETRRQEVKQCLAAGGFRSQGLTILGRKHPDSDSRDAIIRLRDALQQLGPVFASFGLYLASRPDLLALPDCLALAEISNRSAPTPSDQVRQIVHDELDRETEGISPSQRFVKFDPEPFESRLLFQLHHGELESGDLVVVKIIHPRVCLEEDLALLPLLADAVKPRLSDPEQFGSLIDDFGHAMTDAVDCRRVAESLESLSHDIREMDKLSVPKVHQDLCSRNILVTERLDGRRLDQYLAKLRDNVGPFSDSASSVDGVVADELARQICDVWLLQAFDGTMLPIDVRPENILIRSPTQFAILDGTFVRLPRAAKENLLSYFVANATDESSKALASLLKELDVGNRRISDSALDRLFRQVVAFRDGSWEDGGRTNCLSDTLFAQWRLAAANGYRPLRHLTQVYRGAFHIASLARQLAPERDSLLEGVKDLRLTKLLHDISSMMQPSYWGGQADRLAALMVLGPRHLDDALTMVGDHDKPHVERHSVPRSTTNLWNALLIALLAVTGFVLFHERLGAALPPEWSERISAAVFLLIGGLVIRLITTSVDQKA